VSGIVINQDQFEIPYSHEARALYSHSAADWLTAVDESELWLSDEPFASRPAVFGSFIAAEHLEDFERSERICREGLIASPNDATLVNNLAFALANQGRLIEAQTQLDAISTTAAQPVIEICRDATQGFIAFRSGDYSRGREYYQRAIEKAAASNMASLKVRASIHFAREELSINTQNAVDILKQALALVKPINDPDSIGLLQRLLVVLQGQTKVEGNLDKIITEVGKLLKSSKPPLRPMQELKLQN
jgi:tetratricopeptide (TPR) repeat protein